MVAVTIAWRDAKRHGLRTVLAVLLIAVPLAAGLSMAIASATRENTASAALRSIPDGAGAVIETYPLSPDRLPLAQPYHGATLVIPDSDVMGANGAQVESVLGQAVEEVVQSSNLLLHSGDHFAVATLTEANGAMRYVNAEADALLPAGLASASHSDDDRLALTSESDDTATQSSVSMKAPPTPAVITEAVAENLQVAVGGQIQVVSVNESREQEIKSAHFEVAAVVAGDQPQVFSRFATLSQARKDRPGVVRLFFTGADVSWPQVMEMNHIGALVVSRQVLSHPPDAKDLYPVEVPVERIMLYGAFVGVGGALALLLALFLLSPAFTVSAEQATRSLALLSVVGAEPKQLRRIMAAQGLVAGAMGGSLGTAVGTGLGVLLLWIRLRSLASATGISGPAVELSYNLQFAPWPLVPLSFLLGVMAGYLAAYLPARWAAKQDLLVSLSGRSYARSPAPRLWLPAVLLLLAAIVWGALLVLPPFLPPSEGDQQTFALFASLAVLATIFNLLGVLALIPYLLRLLQSLPLPLVCRLAARDAYQHRRRAVPTTAAIAVMILGVSAALSVAATNQANQDDLRTISRGQDAVIIAPRVYSQWDDQLLRQAVEALHLPVKQTVSVMDIDKEWLRPEPRQACPYGTDVDVESRLTLGRDIRCVPYSVPKFSQPQLETNFNVLVMDARALQASKLPVSTRILDEGGIIVGDASTIEDGKAHVAVLDESGKPVRSAQLAAEFLPNVTTIVSPQAARQLELAQPRQVGWFLVFDTPVSRTEFEQAWGNLGELSGLLVHDGPGIPDTGFSDTPLLITVGVFLILTLWLTLSLARTTMRTDIATMNAVGAPPSLARRYSAAQALVTALVSVPVGSLGGIAIAYAVTTINRAFPLESGGPFRRFVVPVEVPLIALSVVVIAVVLGWVSGGTKSMVSTRRIE